MGTTTNGAFQRVSKEGMCAQCALGFPTHAAHIPRGLLEPSSDPLLLRMSVFNGSTDRKPPLLLYLNWAWWMCHCALATELKRRGAKTSCKRMQTIQTSSCNATLKVHIPRSPIFLPVESTSFPLNPLVYTFVVLVDLFTLSIFPPVHLSTSTCRRSIGS
jgi:hypothetical protein